MRKDFSLMNDFIKIDSRKLEDYNGVGTIYEHKKTGAKLLHIECPDDNKAFMVSFRTFIENSNGVPHIIEHSVLCGSENFPVKEPFVDLMRGSLNTFLNAMTFDDRTVYPVSSRNQKDFENLMEVYLDAVFHPLIYKDPLILKQEGWHYEFNENNDLFINGVVFNEMRGALSDPISLLQTEVQKVLYKDSPYSPNSGGDPKEIPNLTQEYFENFHRKYYHPSNALFFLYGDMPIEKSLKRLSEILAGYDKGEAFHAEMASSKQEELVYLDVPVPSNDKNDDRNLLFSFKTVDRTDIDQTMLLSFLSLALGHSEISPLKNALLYNDEIHPSEVAIFTSNSVNPMSLSILLLGLNEKEVSRAKSLVPEILNKIAQEGFDQAYLDAIFSTMSFSILEASQGGTPRGIVAGLNSLNSWHDGACPLDYLEPRKHLNKLKVEAKSEKLVELINKYLLNNKNQVIASTIPDPDLAIRTINEEAERLEKIKQSLSNEDIEEINNICIGLEKRRNEEDSPQNRAKMPKLELSDLPTSPPKVDLEIDDNGNSFLSSSTAGIRYQCFEFRADDIEDRFALGLLTDLLGKLPSAHYSEKELKLKLMLATGSFSANLDYSGDHVNFRINTKWLDDKSEDALKLCEEIILHTNYHEKKIIERILKQNLNGSELYFSNNGHQLAINRIKTHSNKLAAIDDACTGLAFFDQLNKELDNKDLSSLCNRLEAVAKKLFCQARLQLHACADEELRNSATKAIDEMISHLPLGKKSATLVEVTPPSSSEAIIINSEVQYVGMGGNYKDQGYKWDGRLSLVKNLIDQAFLWQAVRVAGGAYGCASYITRKGELGFVSYRDPKLEETYQAYTFIPEFIRSIEMSQDDLREFIIGTLNGYMPVQTAWSKALTELSSRRNGYTYEDKVKEWQAILNAKVEDLKDFAALYESVIEAPYICTVGSKEMIDKNKEIFENVRNLKCKN